MQKESMSAFIEHVPEHNSLRSLFAWVSNNANLRAVKSRKESAVIFRGFYDPQPDNLIATPCSIHAHVVPEISKKILYGVAEVIRGDISAKGIENTVRFKLKDTEQNNEETWHSHPQFGFTVFYCLRGDPKAEVFVLKASDIYKQAKGLAQQTLLEPFNYIEGQPDFSLLTITPQGPSFSRQIYGVSDFQGKIEDLDLPDVKKTLLKIRERRHDKKHPIDGVNYFLDCLDTCKTRVVYESGDLAIYNEGSTLRYSPSFTPSVPDEKARWLQTLSLNL